MRRAIPLSLAFLPGLAFAHHFMGGATPQTFSQGLLSGLGHPLIGIDHAAFIVGAGFALGLVKDGLWGVGALVLGALLGATVHLAGVSLPGSEALVAASAVLVAAAVLYNRPIPLPWLAVAMALAGMLHGYAYAETIFGAEREPLAAYLLGFSLIQACVAAGAYFVHRRIRIPALVHTLGGLVGAVGLVFLALSLA